MGDTVCNKDNSCNEKILSDISNKILEKTKENLSVNREILWANIFNNAIKGCPWLENVSFCPGRWALGYPALYLLYRILRDCKPKSILELGLGESTKMIGSYVKYYEDKTENLDHIVTEHDHNWIRTFVSSFETSNKTMIHKFDIEEKTVIVDGEETRCSVYKNFPEILGNSRKYDFICIDAPIAYLGQKVNRIDVLSILPECLMNDFAIVVDDYNRKSEKEMVEMLVTILNENGIEYAANVYSGEKETLVIASKSQSFLTTL